MAKTKTYKGGMDQLVTFRLGKEIYGIEISRVQEVLHFQNITTMPNAPEFVEGVIEIRNRIVPVVDLRKRFGIKDGNDKKRRLMILDLDEKSLGVIVDDISKVLRIDESLYEAVPDAVINDKEKSCLSKLAKTEDGLIIVLSPERILNNAEKAVLKNFDGRDLINA